VGEDVSDDKDNIIISWTDDFCFTCNKSVQREHHKIKGHRLLSDVHKKDMADKKKGKKSKK
jgi:hypothetical protein